ncbi:hypothetical protein [Phenylobacterium kunshanense]|uniref:Uncharacterized protein n=1 Tax=Phenylobacterium kunshanense TaxID=1445034 RepID=A0A328BPR0_9CAUL|nr:hypothetical protein [Phenylobacterium kunshanense]RAK69103.1 hypothetical protein DJ019_03600 [Phenylobacterium kunshanense]
MITAEAPPAAVAPAPAPATILRRDATEVVAASDLPLTLVKAGQREQALVRRAVFVTSTLTVTRPAGAVDTEGDRYVWTHQAYMQRQVCFTSITGLFACAGAEVEPLPDVERGEAPARLVDDFPLAEAARRRLAEGLEARAAALFEADRKTKVQPALRAAGVSVASAAQAAPARKR